jgi:methionine biosynthesis protein MetW
MTYIGENIIKHQIRYDLEIITQLIKPGAKVLDIGCGDGELLEFLKKHKNADARGLEISQLQVSRALARGLSVIQGDAEHNITFYPNRTFDYAILSQTLQATQKPKEMLQEMMRVAEYGIVSLPNFAHYKNRLHLLFKGVMPVNKTIPFEWYETPNIHFCSICDFEKLCNELNFTIEKKIFLTSKHRLISFFGHEIIANIFAEYGIFLIKKKEFAPTAQEEFINASKFVQGFQPMLKPILHNVKL